LSPARSNQPVSCTPSDTGSKEKSVVGKWAISRPSIFPNQPCYQYLIMASIEMIQMCRQTLISTPPNSQFIDMVKAMQITSTTPSPHCPYSAAACRKFAPPLRSISKISSYVRLSISSRTKCEAFYRKKAFLSSWPLILQPVIYDQLSRNGIRPSTESTDIWRIELLWLKL
jgi:hypothetical protein